MHESRSVKSGDMRQVGFDVTLREQSGPNEFMMGWTPRPTASMCQSGGVEHHLREASVSEIIIIGLRMFSTLMEQTGKGELYSANGSAEESCWISSQPQPSCTVAL